MKALLFNLLLLFITISPSLTAPPSPIQYYLRDNQKVLYTVFTESRVLTIEIIWDPQSRRLVVGGYENVVFTQPDFPGGTTLVEIERRRVEQWTFDSTRPARSHINIRAVIEFFPQFIGLNSRGLRSTTLVPGVFVIDPRLVNLQHLTFNSGRTEDGGYKRVPANNRPLGVNFVFMSVLLPNTLVLDPETEHTIREQGIGAFLRQGAGSQPTQPPLELDAGIWIHLLPHRMSQYQPGDIECEKNPDPGPHPHPDEACHVSSSRPPDPDDQDDPEAQQEAKRQCHYRLDLNNFPGKQGGAGGANQGDQQVGWDFQDNQARSDMYHGSKSLKFIDWIAGGPIFFFLWPYIRTPKKRPQEMMCYGRRGEIINDEENIHDELRR
jgi:hypothetical protein